MGTLLGWMVFAEKRLLAIISSACMCTKYNMHQCDKSKRHNDDESFRLGSIFRICNVRCFLFCSLSLSLLLFCFSSLCNGALCSAVWSADSRAKRVSSSSWIRLCANVQLCDAGQRFQAQNSNNGSRSNITNQHSRCVSCLSHCTRTLSAQSRCRLGTVMHHSDTNTHTEYMAWSPCGHGWWASWCMEWEKIGNIYIVCVHSFNGLIFICWLDTDIHRYYLWPKGVRQLSLALVSVALSCVVANGIYICSIILHQLHSHTSMPCHTLYQYATNNNGNITRVNAEKEFWNKTEIVKSALLSIDANLENGQTVGDIVNVFISHKLPCKKKP